MATRKKILVVILGILCLGLTAFAQNSAVKVLVEGVVLEDTGAPAVGVVVAEKGSTTNVAVTDFDGQYKITVPADAELEFSSLGFKTARVKVAGKTSLKTVMEVDAATLDDVVVIGYGTARKKDLTGAVSSIRTEEIAAAAPKNIQQILQANVAGLELKQQNNARAWVMDVGVRGDSNFDSYSGILWVVDGVVFDGTDDDINPNDIESVDVLKDAAAMSIYGSRAKNGVVCITTKSGKHHADGRPVVNFDANISLVSQSHAPDVMNVDEYLAYKEQYWHYAKGKDDGQPGYYHSPFDLPSGVTLEDWAAYNKYKGDLSDKAGLTKEWLKNRLSLENVEVDNYLAGVNTNWNDLTFHTGLQQNYNASVSQATDRTKQYFSIGYSDRESAIVGDHYGIFRARINLEQKITDWLTIGVTSQFTNRNESGKACKYTNNYRLSPLATDTHTEIDGDYAYRPTGNSKQENPFYKYYYRDKSDINEHLDSNIYVKVQLPWHFDYQYNYTTSFQWNNYAEHDKAGTQCDSDNGSTFRYSERGDGWSMNHILHYNNDFNGSNHRLEGTFVWEMEEDKWFSHGADHWDFQPNDQFTWHLLEAAQNIEYHSYTSDNKSSAMGFMGRLFYSYKDKYMLTLSGRTDAYSDLYYSTKPWATCPSVALGWVFTNEGFMKNASWLNFGKLRASWGVNGNRNTGSTLGVIGVDARRVYLDGDGNPYSATITTMDEMANRALTWEKQSTTNIGLDFAMFDNRFSGTLEFYDQNAFDLMRSRELPNFTGFSSIDVNAGVINNRGIEATLRGELIRTKDFRWAMNATFAFNKSAVRSIDGIMTMEFDENGKLIRSYEADNIDEGLFIGRDVSQYWRPKWLGVWQEDEAEEAAKYDLQPGDLKFLDVDGDYDFDEDDNIFQGYKNPRIRYSIGTTLTWKNFTLDIQGYGRGGNYYHAIDKYCVSGEKQRAWYNVPYWTPENPTNMYSRVDGDSPASPLVNRAYFRLSEVNLQYNFPQKALQKMHMKGLCLYVGGTNLACIAPWWPKWFGDPEFQDEHINRGVIFGAKITL